MKKPKFKIGDIVEVTNGYGFPLGRKKVKEVIQISYSNSGFGYYIEPIDTPWYAFKEEALKEILN
jgi:hypothetical protein